MALAWRHQQHQQQQNRALDLMVMLISCPPEQQDKQNVEQERQRLVQNFVSSTRIKIVKRGTPGVQPAPITHLGVRNVPKDVGRKWEDKNECFTIRGVERQMVP